MPHEICPSDAAVDLIGSLLVEKEYRLSTRRYELNDWTRKVLGGRSGIFAADKDSRTYAGYFVYPDDAEDIKNHSWFEGVPWDTLHLRRPPFVPRVKTWEDTKYFDEDEIVSDIDSADSDEEVHGSILCAVENDMAEDTCKVKPSRSSHHQPEAQHIIPSCAVRLRQLESKPLVPTDTAADPVRTRDPSPTIVTTQPPTDGAVSQAINTGVQWVKEQLEGTKGNSETTKRRKEKKRPRDKILRDADCAAVALRMRKSGAFIGYGYRRPKPVNEVVYEAILKSQSLSSREQRPENLVSANVVDVADIDSVSIVT